MNDIKELTQDQELIRQLWFPYVDPEPSSPSSSSKDEDTEGCAEW